ncbi:putative Lipopolysaccharide N-acetylglucosaminyltransferase [Candidatus Hydrogenisulfobacillus filiaventi]|uniref:Putative Lipopolysaccharide N-acetylglucosaminyltransferase n=1 Tax=Candidatus Hydrogenisulfobacillus filiaventi TaxID=2707344 RepID=A0A6F8ZGJ0_9FIRM|nr:glycosyltransferase family 4 protein [Bacillota bacterium]CAB1128900.1 putative Lipopolysaccharide N-acetylglucosaminyltransferase [Candidatus Hydrogenisulfobacillus filiaventi]
MNIAHLHWAFPPTIGGVETHLALLGPALVRRGHTVSLLCGRPPGTPAVETFEGMTVTRTEWLELNHLTAADFEAEREQVERTIAEFLDAAAPDVVHLHNWHYFTPVPLEAVLAWREAHPRTALVLTAHNVWEDAAGRSFLRYRDRYDAVIAVSEHIRRALLQDGYPAARLHVVHHGLAPAWLEEPPRPPVYPDLAGRPVIFHPARMSLAKGSREVVLAFREVLAEVPDAVLVLAGVDRTVDWGNLQRHEIAAMRELIAASDLEPAIRFRTFAWPEIMAMYDQAALVVYPSQYPEPFGIVVIEAMARQRPVVVTRLGAFPEIVEDGRSGLMVAPGSVAELAAAMRRVLARPEEAARLGREARARVQAAFTLEGMVTATEAVYQTALKARPEVMTRDAPLAS